MQAKYVSQPIYMHYMSIRGNLFEASTYNVMYMTGDL